VLSSLGVITSSSRVPWKVDTNVSSSFAYIHLHTYIDIGSLVPVYIKFCAQVWNYIHTLLTIEVLMKYHIPVQNYTPGYKAFYIPWSKTSCEKQATGLLSMQPIWKENAAVCMYMIITCMYTWLLHVCTHVYT
jgi:hypothetical protein